MVAAAVTLNYHALQHASVTLQALGPTLLQGDFSDRLAVLAAVAKVGASLKHMDSALQDDREVVLAAVRQNGHALQFASAAQQDDREVVVAAVTHLADALQYASEALRTDGEVVGAAMAQAHVVSMELWRNDDFVREAVAQSGHALQVAAERRQTNKVSLLATLGCSSFGWGVNLSFLRRFAAAHAGSCAGKTTAQVTGAVKSGSISWAEPGVIVKETEASKMSYIDAFLLDGNEVGVATVFVSHPWAGGFDALVETCSRFPDEIFWIDIFCKNQWVVNSGDTALELQRGVRASKNSAGKPHVLFVVHPWPTPLALSRIWCLFELMHALLCEAQIHMSMSRAAQTALIGQT